MKKGIGGFFAFIAIFFIFIFFNIFEAASDFDADMSWLTFIPFFFFIFIFGIVVFAIIKSSKNKDNAKGLAKDENDVFAGMRMEEQDHSSVGQDFYHRETTHPQGGIKCPKCKTHMPKENLYCDICGTLLQKECFFCGEINPKENTLCSKCGSKLS